MNNTQIYCKYCSTSHPNSREFFYFTKEGKIRQCRQLGLDNAAKQWRNQREHRSLYYKEYQRKRMVSDPMFKLRKKTRSRLNEILKSNLKSSWLAAHFGCSIADLRKHLESLFKSGMSWENYGRWHIDHIVTLTKAETPEELFKLFHYTNLQPLWAEENIKKGAK